MPLIHDVTIRAGIETRLGTLAADTVPRWGKMTVDQMLWHCNEALEVAIGNRTLPPQKVPIPRAMVKFLVLKFPWSRNAPTNPAFVARALHDFETERNRCLALIDQLTSLPLDRPGSVHPTFGHMSAVEISQLQAKHLDHHLRQFGA